ncbi:MAG: hypothetical protein R6W90_12695 [Ignavibacteriaceae bacterium]
MNKLILLILISVAFTNCEAQVKDSSDMKRKPIDQVFKENQEKLLAIPGVQGYYQGLLEDGEDCIVIMIDKLTDEIQSKLPDSLEGYPVVIEAGGEIKPLPKQKGKSIPEE